MAGRARIAAALLWLGLAGCGGGDEEAPVTSGDAQTVAAAPRVVALSDAEALGVLSAISAAGAEAARSAVDVVETAEVRRYLNVVRSDHEALQAELNAIADSLDLTPTPHAFADRVRTAAQDAANANAQRTAGSDAAVVQQQNQLQETMLAALDSAVLPGTRQELLRQYAGAVRPLVAAHLQRVLQLDVVLKEQARRAAATPVRPRPVTPAAPARVDTVPPPPPDTGSVR